MLPMLIKLSEAWGDPYTVRKAFMDVLSVMFLLVIEFFIFINAGVILHSPSIQQGDEWGKPAIYSATFIIMCLVLVWVRSVRKQLMLGRRARG